MGIVCRNFPSSNFLLHVIGTAHKGSSLVSRHPLVNVQNKTEKSIIFLRCITIHSGGLHHYQFKIILVKQMCQFVVCQPLFPTQIGPSIQAVQLNIVSTPQLCSGNTVRKLASHTQNKVMGTIFKWWAQHYHICTPNTFARCSVVIKLITLMS